VGQSALAEVAKFYGYRSDCTNAPRADPKRRFGCDVFSYHTVLA
jgi:hypothetical protein